MAFHVRDPKIDALVREVALRRGIGITEAIREIAEEALAGEKAREDGGELRKRLQPLFDKGRCNARHRQTRRQAILRPLVGPGGRIDVCRCFGDDGIDPERKGSGSPARLNLGDCFAYAAAKQNRVPLLYKGDDFSHTDLAS